MNANVEVVRLWVDALRSGEYEQGTGALEVLGHDGTSRFCCLGVLCRLAADRGVAVRQTDPGLSRSFRYVAGSTTSALLPDDVEAWAGIDSYTRYTSDPRTLLELNDAWRYSFDQIADVLEETYL